MRAPALPLSDALLSTKDLAARLHVKGGTLREIVAASATLRAGRRYRGTRAYYLESYVVRHMHVEMAAAPTASVTP